MSQSTNDSLFRIAKSLWPRGFTTIHPDQIAKLGNPYTDDCFVSEFDCDISELFE